jgi:hypothetical protein
VQRFRQHLELGIDTVLGEVSGDQNVIGTTPPSQL